ncbi:MAG TPA: polysaccharide deacetylase family protein [Bryobacteraceae bacterium]|jgi:peptidoglycan/xylan/chitin deacetylase (PgdA/CDA1 family)|nr:polysaccharide deacetylase family protein [Bryobacteraceae bacterium]
MALRSIIRNSVCRVLAWGVIAAGHTRRGKRRAFAGNVVTPIYFHNPNPRLFARCIRWLRENGYVFISTRELMGILYEGKNPPRGAAWLSFDDGYKEWLQNVMPVIRDQNIPVTFFIPTGIVANEGLFPWKHPVQPPTPGVRDAMTLPELRVVARCPAVTIGGHTVNHSVTVSLDEERTRFEFGASKKAIEDWTGKEVTVFAYPEGRFDGRERVYLKTFGYKLAATTASDLITPQTDPYLLPRFCVSDNISFPEAVCNMTGAWRPALDRLKKLVPRLARREEPLAPNQKGSSFVTS